MDIQEEEKTFARLEKIIGRYKPTDIEKAIKEFQEFIENGYGCSKLPSSWSIRFALTALQEQAEREKGCEYCKGDALDGLVLTKFCDMPKIALRGGNCPPEEDEKPVFCPACGRRLK